MAFASTTVIRMVCYAAVCGVAGRARGFRSLMSPRRRTLALLKTTGSAARSHYAVAMANCGPWRLTAAGILTESMDLVDAEFPLPLRERVVPLPLPEPQNGPRISAGQIEEMRTRRRSPRSAPPPGMEPDCAKLRFDTIYGPTRANAIQVAHIFAQRFGIIMHKKTHAAAARGAPQGFFDIYVAFARPEAAGAAAAALDGQVLQEGLFVARVMPAWRPSPPPRPESPRTRLRIGPLYAEDSKAAAHVACSLLSPFGAPRCVRATREPGLPGYFRVETSLGSTGEAVRAREALHASCPFTPRPVGRGLELNVDFVRNGAAGAKGSARHSVR